MAIFFLVVGLEIKREIIKGQLRHLGNAILPIGAAIGGMIVPAVLFIIINASQPGTLRGWAIPTATDIAFTLAVMSLLGSRVKSSLKLFLLTLAIVDDIGSVAVIALFYGTSITFIPILTAVGIATTIIVLSRLRKMPMGLFVLLSIGFWVAVQKSGINASIAGVFLGLMAPLQSRTRLSVAERLERSLIPVSTFLVVPLFAFASLGLVFNSQMFSNSGSLPLVWGIFAGFVIGKVIGVTLASWILVKLRLSRLPEGTFWFQIIGVGFLAGIGFTVSVLITDVTFGASSSLAGAAKLSILVSSIVSAVIGYILLRHRPPRRIVSFLSRKIIKPHQHPSLPQNNR